MYFVGGFLWVVIIIVFLSSYSLGNLENGRNKGTILEEVEPPIHECELGWGHPYDPVDECVTCNLRIEILDYNATLFSDCDITIELLQGLQEVIDYALHVINEGFLDYRFPQLLRQNDGYCSTRRRDSSNIYSSCEDIISAMQSTMCEIIEQICLLLNPGEAEKCYDDMPTPPSTTPGSTTTTQSPGNPGDRECIKCLLDAIGVYSDKLRDIQACFLGAIDTMKQEHAAEVDDLNTEIKQLENNLKDSLWDIMLAQIENPETAAIVFPQLYDSSYLVSYVEQVYTLGNYTNVIVFGFRLPLISQTGIVYYTLYDMILKSNHLTHGNIIVFSKYLKDSEAKSCPTDIKDCGADFDAAKNLVELFTREYIRLGVDNIKMGNWRGLLEFGNPSVVNHVGESFQLILEELVGGSCSDFRSTFNFVRNIRWNEHRYVALQRFKTCVTNQYHMISIAYEIKNAHDNLQGPDSHKVDEVRDNLMKLKESLNLNIQVIVWDDGGTINAAGQGFLAPGFGSGGYTGVRIVTTPANNKWTFVKDNENLNEDSHQRFGYRIRHQSGVYLGVPYPIRRSGSREPLCVESAPSENWIDSRFYWELKFDSVGDRIFLYHPARRLHMGYTGLYMPGNMQDYMVVAK